MKNIKIMSLLLSFALLAPMTVKADTITQETAVPSQSNIVQAVQVETTADLAIAAYTEPYSVIQTPLGSAIFLQSGCTGSYVSALQSNLNSLSGVGISIAVDGIYGSATVQAVQKLQTYCKNSKGCTSMLIDGVAGVQTWTAIYAIQNGSNPHIYIP